MESEVAFKYFHYTPQKNSSYSRGFPYTDQGMSPDKIKSFKVKIDKKLKYIIELYYFEEFVFIKFHPKIYEGSKEKYKLVGMNLKIGDIRRLLNTCCKIVLQEMDKCDDPEMIYGLIGQWYKKDNKFNRLVTRRFDIYRKQATTYFSFENFIHYEEQVLNLYCICSNKNRKYKKQLKKLVDKIAMDKLLREEFMTERAKELYLQN